MDWMPGRFPYHGQQRGQHIGAKQNVSNGSLISFAFKSLPTDNHVVCYRWWWFVVVVVVVVVVAVVLVVVVVVVGLISLGACRWVSMTLSTQTA
eukprot:4177358-Amphidinium_carterae.1